MPGHLTLRLGTRRSLLALAQSRIVVRALKAADPGLDVCLVTLETRGDRNRDVPLSTVSDPGFFSAEIDVALRSGAVDFCVHSLKDLPLAPRAGICTAAIPIREDPRDVVVFRREVIDRLCAGEALRIGSSSGRRTAMALAFLADALPRCGERPARLVPAPLRGTVEQRLKRVRLPATNAGALDGVVLALAGIARLWGDRDGHAAIAPLLQDTRLMVLPLSLCPTAPGQGALAVDCRRNDERVANRLAAINDPATARRVRRELALLAARPEEERGHFGATAISHDNCGTLLFVRGQSGQNDFRQVAWNRPPRPSMARPWDGARWVHAGGYRPFARTDFGTPAALFLAHWRALPPGARLPVSARIWVSGVASWRRLARRGVWVEGCADNLGFEALADTLCSPALRLPPPAGWTVLTHEDAAPSWAGSGVGRVIPTYAIAEPKEEPARASIRGEAARATHFFWGSAAQYHALRGWLPADAHHACGPGKTYRALQADGAPNLRAFPSRREWQAWVA